MGVLLKDIAKELGLTSTTVSWVLSGQGDKRAISLETQKKVMKYAKTVNYQPNLLARGLNSGKSETIGLVVPSISDTFYSSITKEIEHEAEKLGYSLIICSSESEKEREIRMINMLKSKQVDGIIIAPTKRSRKQFDTFLKESFPFVLFDRFFSDMDSNYVIIDNENSSCQLVKHLVEQGRKKIAIITTNPHLETLNMRYNGYKKALTDSGMEINPNLYGFVEYENYEKNIIPVLDNIFENVPDVDGFFFTTHILALEAFLYFHDRNIDINGKGYGLACIHEVSAFRILSPNISVARMPVEDIGKNAVRILYDNIEYVGKHKKQNYPCSKMILPCTLKLK
ncbi:catabolite control protein A [Bacteroidia bacterium]|nr:catabolite control protein A [Bacteroidia bacterium]